MKRFSLSQRTLQRALDLVGDSSLLARRLRVPQDDLHGWLTGEETPPKSVFFDAVDILCEAPEPLFEGSTNRYTVRDRAA